MAFDLFLIDTDAAVGARLAQRLTSAGLSVRTFTAPGQALHEVRAGRGPQALLAGMHLPGMNGLELMHAMHAADPHLPVVLMVGQGDMAMAVQAIVEGAHDCIEETVLVPLVVVAMQRAIEQRRLLIENRALKQQVAQAEGFGILGQSAAIQALQRSIGALGPTSTDVLLVGEPGTGKALVARALHACSGRRGPFITLECGDLPEHLLEAELFGHRRRSRPASFPMHSGRIEKARGGTLFLRDVDLLPMSLQGRLLQVMSLEGETPSDTEAGKPDCRIVSATRADLWVAAERGRFRADLHQRLAGSTLRLPTLREIPADIPLLFAHFVADARRQGLPGDAWTAQELADWQQRPWPGNARELRNFAERWCLGLERAQPGGVQQVTLAEVMARAEQACIRMALQQAEGNVARAAEQLGLPRKTLYDRLSRHGIEARSFRRGVA